MKRNTLVATLALTLATITSAFAGGEGWVTDFEAAKKSAAEGKKDLLIDFTGSDWCGWCIKLNKEVFDHEPFKAGTKDKFVLVELDFPNKKELEPALKAQNQALQKEYKVRGFPTIIMADATGKPYAKTGYKAGGPESYVTHLDELRAIREKRDAAFAKADAAKSDKEKAAFLVEGLKALNEELVENNYSDVLDQISKLDPEDATGYVKERKAASEQKAQAAAAQGKISDFMKTTIQPLMVAKEFDKALGEVKTFIKDNPNTPAELKAGMTLDVGLSGAMSTGNVAAANTLVDEVAKDYPESTVGRNADKIKENILKRMEAMKPKAAE